MAQLRYWNGTAWVDAVIGAIGPTGVTGATGPTGPTGPTGVTGAKGGLRYTFSTTTTDADPGNGIFRFNNAAIASTTQIFIDLVDGDGVTQTPFLDSWDDSTNTVDGTLVIQGRTTDTSVSTWNITGVTTATGYRKIVATYVSGTAPANGADCVIQFSRAGDAGSYIVSSSAPSAPQSGSLWFDSETARTFIYYDSYWVEIGASATVATVSSSAPSSPISGQIWFDPDVNSTYVYYNNSWVAIMNVMTDTKTAAILVMDIGA